MKTLILYATKNGAAREIAQRISKQIDGAIVRDLKNGGVPPLDGFDCVIVGSPVYAGIVRKEAKAFVEKNTSALCSKRLALFISGLDGSREKEYFNANYPSEILQAAKMACFLGGIFDPKKAGFMGRLVMKAVAKQSEYTDSIDDDKIKQFAEAMKS
ncbi:flavodoxin domain-containing protein [Paenibacillus thiaminolyticus]|uniref:flavodoxin domain-containing protein n=1 Tax=Paenibacillus thiaminolyticus TaxID=49283 RepID=UPI00232B84A8|nr:flavodoxin domain-containing protein [Paenibacillus thiaminolyticus]WCF05930.1 flavodoxin domain-containing protein [Paenibacillus thiaminolyticus]